MCKIPLELELDKLRKEQRPSTPSEPIPLYLPLDIPAPSKKKEDTEEEKRGVWEISLT